MARSAWDNARRDLLDEVAHAKANGGLPDETERLVRTLLNSGRSLDNVVKARRITKRLRELNR